MSMAPYEIQKQGLERQKESIKSIQVLSANDASEKSFSKASPAFFPAADKSAGESIKAPEACRENLFASAHSFLKRTSFLYNDTGTQKLEDKAALSNNDSGHYFLHGVLVGTPPNLFNWAPK